MQYSVVFIKTVPMWHRLGGAESEKQAHSLFYYIESVFFLYHNEKRPRRISDAVRKSLFYLL